MKDKNSDQDENSTVLISNFLYGILKIIISVQVGRISDLKHLRIIVDRIPAVTETRKKSKIHEGNVGFCIKIV